MKKFLSIFLIVQMLLFSYIFNQSVYPIYMLNNFGDSNLKSYAIENSTGNALKDFYEYFDKTYLEEDLAKLQIIKMPMTSLNNTTYEIYHSKLADLSKEKSISKDKTFIYLNLEEEDFIDNTGVFYTDLSIEQLNTIGKHLNISIKEHNESTVEYDEILKLNGLDFAVLMILTILVLFIYTFMRIKVNALKKMIGFSPFRMILDSCKEFIFINLFSIILAIIVHAVYYSINHIFVMKYYIGLLIGLLLIVLLNVCLLFLTQISIRFIDISSMIKNKVYSDRLVYTLQGTKFLLIIIITITLNVTLSNYSSYKESVDNLDRYRELDNFYTGKGYNSQEYDKVFLDKNELTYISSNMKNLYDDLNSNSELLFESVNMVSYISSTNLNSDNTSIDNLMNSYKKNYVILNNNYINKFLELKDDNNKPLGNLSINEPCILVPKKYKDKESEVKKYYIDMYNDLVNYDVYEGVPSDSKKNISDIKILYLNNDINYEFFLLKNNDNYKTIKDSIILLDTGQFSGLYYLNCLSNQQLSFLLDNREIFSKKLYEYKLHNLINAATLLTPYMDEINFNKFVMLQSLMFSIIFIITLLFVLYTANYTEIMVNKKRFAIEYTMGFTSVRSLFPNLVITIIMSCLIIPAYLFNINVYIYILILIIDLMLLFSLYKIFIIKNAHEVLKGG